MNNNTGSKKKTVECSVDGQDTVFIVDEVVDYEEGSHLLIIYDDEIVFGKLAYDDFTQLFYIDDGTGKLLVELLVTTQQIMSKRWFIYESHRDIRSDKRETNRSNKRVK